MSVPDATDPPLSQQAAFKYIVNRFGNAWLRGGKRPAIEDFLPTEGALRHAILIELARMDLELRRDGGEEVSPDEYLRRFPELAADAKAVSCLKGSDAPTCTLVLTDTRPTPEPTLPLPPGATGRRRTEAPSKFPSESFSQEPMAGTSSQRSMMIRDYELVEQIGQGGMGVVYRATHKQLGKTVAIKLIKQEFPNPELRERFRRELQAAGKLNHPNIVLATDGGEVDNTLYLVMEFLEGETLDKLVARRGPLPFIEACDYVRQCALALAALGDAGLVHRDVKPSNLFLTSSGLVKLLDLGVARITDAEIRATQPGQLLGTADYMAPEQTVGATDVDIRADLYSLGCVLYFLLAGEPPYPAPQYSSTAQKLIAHEGTPFPDIRKKRTDVPDPIAELIFQLAAKDPALRRKDPQRIADKLRNFERPLQRTAVARPKHEPDDLETVVPHIKGTPIAAKLEEEASEVDSTIKVTVEAQKSPLVETKRLRPNEKPGADSVPGPDDRPAASKSASAPPKSQPAASDQATTRSRTRSTSTGMRRGRRSSAKILLIVSTLLLLGLIALLISGWGS